MKVRNIILGLFLVVSLCHDCHCRTFYVDSEEYPDIHSRQSIGQKMLNTEELIPAPDDALDVESLGTASIVKQTFPDLLSQWQPTTRLTSSSRFGGETNKRSGLDEVPSLFKQNRHQPKSVFRNNRGAFAKRQMILYRQCFFNPISCFRK